MSRRWMSALPLAFAACAIPPKDPFLRAEYELKDDDLLQALRAYDAVPVSHPRYPDARAAAVEVEMRMRRCHELILEALMLRGEWRDAEALDRLRRAQEHWPLQPSLQQWIAATEQRLKLFGERTAEAESAEVAQEQPAMPIVEVQPPRPEPQPDIVALPQPARGADDPVESQPLPQPSAEVASEAQGPTPLEPGAADVGEPGAVESQDGSETQPQLEAEGATRATEPKPNKPEPSPPEPSKPEPKQPVPHKAEPEPEIARPLPTGEDPVALGLVSVEARLARAEREGAVHDLIELSRRFPKDRRVQRRLGPLLHQRALMSYGQGLVAAAVADWRRVLAMDPDNDAVRRLLKKAQAELREPSR